MLTIFLYAQLNLFVHKKKTKLLNFLDNIKTTVIKKKNFVISFKAKIPIVFTWITFKSRYKFAIEIFKSTCLIEQMFICQC